MASVEPGASAATWRSVAAVASRVRYAEAEVDQAPPLPGLRAGPVDLEDPQTGDDLRPALGEGVQAGSENDVLPDAAAGLLHDQILDEAGAGHDGGPEEGRELRVHVQAVAPAVVGGRQPQADLVLEHVRRRIHQDVQGPPQRDPHRRAVRRHVVLIVPRTPLPHEPPRSMRSGHDLYFANPSCFMKS
jgi:hypothetical protein